MHLEESIDRLKEIISEMESAQLPLHEMIKLHEEGTGLIHEAESLLKDAEQRIKVRELEIDSPAETKNVEHPSSKVASSEDKEIDLF